MRRALGCVIVFLDYGLDDRAMRFMEVPDIGGRGSPAVPRMLMLPEILGGDPPRRSGH